MSLGVRFASEQARVLRLTSLLQKYTALENCPQREVFLIGPAYGGVPPTSVTIVALPLNGAILLTHAPKHN